MKFLDPTQATDTAQQPVKNGTLQFLQDSHKENLANLIQGLIGPGYSPNKLYRLWGGAINLNTLTPPYSASFSAGGFFYNGECFSMNAGSCYVSTGQTLLYAIQTEQYTPASPLQADPVVFTDGVSRNVHNIRTISIVGGPSTGAGVSGFICDWNQIIPINMLIETPIVYGYGLANVTTNYPIISVNVPPLNLTTTGLLTQSGTWPNITLNVPTPASLPNQVLCAGRTPIGNIPGTTGGNYGGPYQITFATDAIPPVANINTNNYYVMGSLISLGGVSSDNDASTFWVVEDSTRNIAGFTIWCRESWADTQDLAFEWICFAK